MAKYGEPILVRIENDLPEDHVGFGTPEISTHLHRRPLRPRRATASRATTTAEGQVRLDALAAGKVPEKDHHYPNVALEPRWLPWRRRRQVGASARSGTTTTAWSSRRRMSTAAWPGFTCCSTNRFERRGGPGPGALRLPSGVGKIRHTAGIPGQAFDSGGYLYFDRLDPEGIVGDKFCVNGKVQPFFPVERRKYRFRLLDGSALRFYEFYLVHEGKDQQFHQIANDGNLLPAPVLTDRVRLGVAERADVVIDFAKYPLGSKLYIVNKLEHLDGRRPTGRILNPGTQIMRIDVDREPATPDKSYLPAVLRALPPIDLKKSRPERRWDFGALKYVDGERPAIRRNQAGGPDQARRRGDVDLRGRAAGAIRCTSTSRRCASSRATAGRRRRTKPGARTCSCSVQARKCGSWCASATSSASTSCIAITPSMRITT